MSHDPRVLDPLKKAQNQNKKTTLRKARQIQSDLNTVATSTACKNRSGQKCAIVYDPESSSILPPSKRSRICSFFLIKLEMRVFPKAIIDTRLERNRFRMKIHIPIGCKNEL